MGIVRTVAVTPDGTKAVSASSDRTLRVWDIGTGKCLHILAGHRNWINAVAVTPDGTKAVSASSDHTLRVWEIISGKVIMTFTGDEKITKCAFANNGKKIFAGGADGRVYILGLEITN